MSLVFLVPHLGMAIHWTELLVLLVNDTDIHLHFKYKMLVEQNLQ